jgi:hypothetical protein
MNGAQFEPIAECGNTDQAHASTYHRRWFVTNEACQWLNRSRCPTLATVAVGLRFGYLVLTAPGMLRLDIPLDVIEDDDSVRSRIQIEAQTITAVDEGTLAAAWISNALQIPARLWKIHPDSPAIRWPA